MTSLSLGEDLEDLHAPRYSCKIRGSSSGFQLGVESNYFAFALLCSVIGSKFSCQFFQPITSETKTNRDSQLHINFSPWLCVGYV